MAIKVTIVVSPLQTIPGPVTDEVAVSNGGFDKVTVRELEHPAASVMV